MRDDPRPQEIYRHFKGGLYQIITLARHSQTGDMLVIYQALYENFTVYARELSEFMSETDHEKYPSASQKFRFEKAEYQNTDIRKPELRSEPEKQECTKPEEKQSEEQIYKTPEDKVRTAEFSENKQSESAEEAINIDPLVMEFLDADSYGEKLNILAALHCRITDEMINTMSVASDIEINEGDIEERYEALKTCLVTLEKYECNRLR